MPLPVITNLTPVVQPAVQAATFNELYLTELNLRTGETPSDQTINVGLWPYDQASGTLAPRLGGMPMPRLDQGVRLPPVNVWAEAQRSSLFAQAMGAVIQYAALATQEYQLNQQIAKLLQPFAGQVVPDAVAAEVKTLQDSLATVRTSMGVQA